MVIPDEVPGVIATILLESGQAAEELEPPFGRKETHNPGGPHADLPTKHSFVELAVPTCTPDGEDLRERANGTEPYRILPYPS